MYWYCGGIKNRKKQQFFWGVMGTALLVDGIYKSKNNSQFPVTVAFQCYCKQPF